jgi:O-antigen/teichoic acid export membrane protein
MHPRRFVRDSFVYAAAQYVYRLLLMARGLVGARLLGPAAFGAWNAIQLVMDYGLLATLGTFQGLDQTVPPRIVDGDHTALDRLKRAGLFNVLVFSMLYGVGVLAYLGFTHGKIESFWGVRGVVVAVACVVLTNIGYFLLNLLRAHGDIPAVSAWFLVQGIVGAGLALALIPRFGVWALLGGWLAGTSLAVLATLWKARAIAPILPRPSSESLNLIRIGAPMYLFSAATILRSVDRLIILKFLDALALGYYSLAVTAMTLLLYVPDSVSYVLYPQLLKRYRAGGDQPGAIRDQVVRTFRAVAILTPAMCGLTYLWLRDLMAALLPKFLPGLEAGRLVCFGAGGLAFVGLSAIVLMTLRRQSQLVPAVLSGAVLGAVLDFTAVKLGLGITGVGLATMIAYLLNGMLMLALTFAALDASWRRTAITLARHLLPLAGAFAIAAAIDRVMPAPSGPWGLRLGRMTAEAGAFIALYALLALPFGRGTGLKQMLRELRPGWGRRSDGESA